MKERIRISPGSSRRRPYFSAGRTPSPFFNSLLVTLHSYYCQSLHSLVVAHTCANFHQDKLYLDAIQVLFFDKLTKSLFSAFFSLLVFLPPFLQVLDLHCSWTRCHPNARTNILLILMKKSAEIWAKVGMTLDDVRSPIKLDLIPFP